MIRSTPYHKIRRMLPKQPSKSRSVGSVEGGLLSIFLVTTTFLVSQVLFDGGSTMADEFPLSSGISKPSPTNELPVAPHMLRGLKFSNKKEKVFGLGLSKHATTSMADAMKLLNYKSIHSDRKLAHFMHHPREPLNLTGIYDDIDSVWDIPTAAYYRELHMAYPDAKFVLAVRNSERWLTSFQSYQDDYQFYRWGCVIPERIQRLHEFVYGSRTLTRNWTTALERHNSQVIEYFRDYPDQLLIVDIEEDNLWSKLCYFLDHSTGPCMARDLGVFPPFPMSNSQSEHEAASAIQKECPSARSTSPSNTSPYAYVMILCDPQTNGLDDYLRMILVLAENIRQFDQTNDIVLLVRGQLGGDQRGMLQKFGIQDIRVGPVGGRVEIEDPFHQVEPAASACFMAKLRALQLLQYEKVMYVDSDIIFQADPSPLFQEPGFVGFEGSLSPLNGGLYVMTPSQQAFTDIQDIANSGSFDAKDGWLNYGEIPDWRNPGAMHNWTFWCSFSDQGIVYYYYHILTKTATIHKKLDNEWLYVHFAGLNKPFFQNRNNLGATKKRFREATARWYDLWDIVAEKIDVEADIVPNPTKKAVVAERLLPIDPYDENSCGLVCRIIRWFKRFFGL